MFDASADVAFSVHVQNGRIPITPHAVVVGDLNVEGVSSLTDLPEALTIEGSLLLRGTSIRLLPSKLRVSGYIELEGCFSLKKLAEDLNVGGDLDLELCSSLTRLPNRLFVGGNLYLFGTAIRTVPKTAVIGGSVFDISR
jgi:hypothetical protein